MEKILGKLKKISEEKEKNEAQKCEKLVFLF